MEKVLYLAIKDLRVILSDKGNVFWVFGFPVFMALLFGAIYSGAGGEPSGIKIAVVDEDNTEFSGLYKSKLESYEALEIVYLPEAEAIEQVRKGKLAAVVFLKKVSETDSRLCSTVTSPGWRLQKTLRGRWKAVISRGFLPRPSSRL
jgi:hypothetical protein